MPRAGQLLHPPPTPPPSDLAKQLVFDESQAVRKGLNEHGTLFNQIINVTGANGRTIPITTGWITRWCATTHHGLPKKVNQMFELHDVVILKRTMPEVPVPAGSEGTIVHVHQTTQ